MNDYGIAHYLILPNGNLQGLWVHSGTTNVYAEVAIKRNTSIGLQDTYDFSYRDASGPHDGRLVISGNGVVFQFEWWVGQERWFQGTGLMVSADVIAVAYRDEPTRTKN